MGLPPVATYTQHTTHLSTSEPLLHTYQQWNSMDRSKLSHWVKGRNILLKRNYVSCTCDCLTFMSNKRSIKQLINHANKSCFNHALRLKMSLAYFQYPIKTPFGIFYKTDVLNQTATYREGNARHTPRTDCQRTANCTLHSFSLTVYPVTLGNVTFRKPNRFVNAISCSFTFHTLFKPKRECRGKKVFSSLCICNITFQ